jgi:ribosomal protein S27AE
MDEMTGTTFDSRICPACGERNARHDQDELLDGRCSYTGAQLDELERLTQLALFGATS